MEIQWADPIDEYPALKAQDGAVDTVWAYPAHPNSVITLVNGFNGLGKALRVGYSAGIMDDSVKRMWNADAKLTFHFALMPETIGTDGSYADCLTFLDSAAVRQFGVRLGLNGKLELRRVSGGTLLAQSDKILTANQISRCCMTVDLSTAHDNPFTMSINGDVDAGLAGSFDLQSTANQNVGGILLNYLGDNPNTGEHAPIIQYRDFVVGTGECVDWGPLEVSIHPPIADVAVSWDRSVGADNFANVDEIPFTGEADYNSSLVINNQDIFDFQDPTRVPESIVAFGMMSIARKEDSAARFMQNVLRVGGVDYPDGVDKSLMETFSQIQSFWQENPDTAADWDPADFAPLQGGYKYTGP